jgi:uncharacterized protein (TIGR02117 family)
MKKLLRIILKILLSLIGLVFLYISFAFILSIISTTPEKSNNILNHEIFIKSNGVHTDVIINQQDVEESILGKLDQDFSNYLAFGWGDKGFYIDIPTWDSLTFSVAANAMFLQSETAMHVTPYNSIKSSWVSVKISKTQLNALLKYIEASFKFKDAKFQKIDFAGYTDMDAFYEAKGSYNLFKTCNVWTGQALKQAGIKTAIWSPFDWGIIWNAGTN